MLWRYFPALVLFISPSLWAAELKGEALPPFSGESAAQLLLGLLAVIGMIFLMAWFLRRMGATGGLGHKGLRVISMLPLGTRERLVLVQAGDEQLLLGVAPGRVNLIKTLDEPIIVGKDVESGDFARRLKEAMGRGR